VCIITLEMNFKKIIINKISISEISPSLSPIIFFCSICSVIVISVHFFYYCYYLLLHYLSITLLNINKFFFFVVQALQQVARGGILIIGVSPSS